MFRYFAKNNIIFSILLILAISIITYDNYQINQLKSINKKINEDNERLKKQNVKYLSNDGTLTTKFKIIKILRNYIPNNEESYLIINHYNDYNDYIVKISNNLLNTKFYEDNSYVISENQYYTAQFIISENDKIPYNDITTLFNDATLNSINRISEEDYDSSKDQLCGSLNC